MKAERLDKILTKTDCGISNVTQIQNVSKNIVEAEIPDTPDNIQVEIHAEEDEFVSSESESEVDDNEGITEGDDPETPSHVMPADQPSTSQLPGHLVHLQHDPDFQMVKDMVHEGITTHKEQGDVKSFEVQGRNVNQNHRGRNDNECVDVRVFSRDDILQNVKSPSDTMLYTPALNKGVPQTADGMVDCISNFVENIRLQTSNTLPRRVITVNSPHQRGVVAQQPHVQEGNHARGRQPKVMSGQSSAAAEVNENVDESEGGIGNAELRTAREHTDKIILDVEHF